MEEEKKLKLNLNPNRNNKEKKNELAFEFCKVCKLNHNQGRRHNYLPNHTKSLSSFLSRFLKKLSDVRFFLKNPTLLLPEHASRNRLWCVFCDSDIEELDSSFACSNVINHLASSEHLKNLKDFLWKYGGGMNRVDSFRVSETDLAKWDKRCRSLKSATMPSSKGSYGPLLGPSKDIHNELSSDNMDNFEKNAIHSFTSCLSNGFVPLQTFTNEKHQVSFPEATEVANVGPLLLEVASLPVCSHSNMDLQCIHVTESTTKDLNAYKDNQRTLIGNSRKSLVGWSPSVGGVGRLSNGESSNQVLQSFTHISPLFLEEPKANVHSGAPPPWFEMHGENQLNFQVSTGLHVNGIVPSSNKSGKSQKLNPKRVGAAWAEKRKMELEMEKRGEVVTNCDANWLPNFGRVWQSGSRKESRKEFEMEKQKLPKVDNISETPIKIQPYISKRMRRDAGEIKDAVDSHFERTTNII